MRTIGQGLVVEVVQELLEMFKSILKFFGLKFDVCLPHPLRPDFMVYGKIGVLIAICWVLLFLEPIGLRIRSVVMRHHFPERSLERNLWLYHHILRKRANFFKFARRRARKKYLKDGCGKDEVMTCWEIFKAKVDG